MSKQDFMHLFNIVIKLVVFILFKNIVCMCYPFLGKVVNEN